MENKANDVVDDGVVGEGVMAALVGDYPETTEEDGLEGPVEKPNGEAERSERDGRDEVYGEKEKKGGDEEIVEEIREGGENGTVEAVRRNGFF